MLIRVFVQAGFVCHNPPGVSGGIVFPLIELLIDYSNYTWCHLITITVAVLQYTPEVDCDLDSFENWK